MKCFKVRVNVECYKSCEGHSFRTYANRVSVKREFESIDKNPAQLKR